MRLVPIVMLIAAVLIGPLPAAAANMQGLNGGWVVGDTGVVSFPHSLSSQLPIMQEAGAGWVRINFRLGDCYQTWTTPASVTNGCDLAIAGRTALQAYDAAVDAARARNLQVLGLLSNEAWHGDQPRWQEGDAEVDGGTGDNTYIHEFAGTAGLLAEHFAGRVNTWEVWNEPNSWEWFDDAGHIGGSSFIYPSNFAWLLSESYDAIKKANGSASVISGAVLGTDIGGVRMNVVVHGKPQQIVKHGETPPVLRPTYATTCSSSVPSGADFLCDTYRAGLTLGDWAKRHPLDQVGQHFYVDLGSATKSLKIASYLEDVHRAYVAFEGAATPKKTQVTEFGWIADPASSRYSGDASMQAENLRTAYTTLANAPFVARGYWFAVQDIEEAGQFFGLVRNAYQAGDTSAANLALRKPAFGNYQRYAG